MGRVNWGVRSVPHEIASELHVGDGAENVRHEGGFYYVNDMSVGANGGAGGHLGAWFC